MSLAFTPKGKRLMRMLCMLTLSEGRRVSFVVIVDLRTGSAKMLKANHRITTSVSSVIITPFSVFKSVFYDISMKVLKWFRW